MASVVKREKSRFWTACFTDRDGRQLKRSTKTTDRNAALQIAVELEGVERRAKQGALTTTQLRKVLNDVSEKVNGDSLNVPSVEDYFRDWLNGIEARNRATTLERYKNAAKWFLEHLQGKAKKPVSSVTPQDVENYLTWRLKSGVANKTAIVDIKIIKIAFRRAENYVERAENPEITHMRDLVMVIGKDKTGKTLILGKDIEFQFLQGPGWTPVHSSRMQITFDLQNRINEGEIMLSKKIKAAIGETE